MDSVTIASIICITLFSLFGIFSILTKQGNRSANKILGIFFLLWSLDFLDGILLLNGFYLEHIDFALWGDSIVFLYGPLLYFYTFIVTGRSLTVNSKLLLHFIPFVVYLILIYEYFHSLPRDIKPEILR